jgi:hypothetical protein
MLKSIDRLCEAVNYEYFHRSAAGLPKRWRFIEREEGEKDEKEAVI